MTILTGALAPGCGCDVPERVMDLISIAEALRRIAELATPVAGAEAVPLAASCGRILARPVRCGTNSPPFDNSAMDGYAVDTRSFSGTGPWTLRVSARVAAGQVATAPLEPGSAARVFTGAPVPDGADAVVMQEHVHRSGDRIRIETRPEPGLNIRRAGSDMAEGETALDAGVRLGPREIAACAAAGASELTIRRRLRVGLLVTGDEVRAPGCPRAAGQIWDVNTPMLTAALTAPSIELVACEPGDDSRDALRRQLAAMADRVDLLVTTGGVSVGEEDHVKPALLDLGGRIAFSGVAIKPGKPVSAGFVGAACWLGLPGNPRSAFVTWQVFGAALVRRLTGERGAGAQRRHVLIADAVRRKPGRCELRTARVAGFDASGREVVQVEDAVHSARVGGLAEADGLVFLPAVDDHLPAGALVEFEPFCGP